LHFHVIGSGGDSSTISLSNGMLSDNLAEGIPATWVGDSVRVVAAAVAEATPPTAVNSSPEVTAPDKAAPSPAKTINWPVLWGVIGAAIAVGLIVFLRVRRRKVY